MLKFKMCTCIRENYVQTSLLEKKNTCYIVSAWEHGNSDVLDLPLIWQLRCKSPFVFVPCHKTLRILSVVWFIREGTIQLSTGKGLSLNVASTCLLLASQQTKQRKLSRQFSSSVTWLTGNVFRFCIVHTYSCNLVFCEYDARRQLSHSWQIGCT